MRCAFLLLAFLFPFCIQKTTAQYITPFGFTNALVVIKQQPGLTVRVSSETKKAARRRPIAKPTREQVPYSPQQYPYVFKVTGTGLLKSVYDSLNYSEAILFPAFIKAESNGFAYSPDSFYRPVYDSLQRLISVSSPRGHVADFRYIDSFHVLSRYSANSYCCVYSFDREGRLLEEYTVDSSLFSQPLVAVPPADPAKEHFFIASYTYDNKNRLARVETKHFMKEKGLMIMNRQTFTYDKLNRTISSVYENFWNPLERKIVMRYQYYE